MNKPYKRCMTGGTFDRFHDAHYSLLLTAIQMAEEVFVGVVSDQLGKEIFQKKQFKDMIQSYEIRRKAVIEFLEEHTDHIEVEPLFDPWGPAPSDPQADLIVVSHETEETAFMINEMRVAKGLPKLDIIVIPWVYVNGELISSSRLRKEEQTQKF